MKITSIQNPKIKQLVRLKNKRERDREQLFLIEGYRECLRAKEADVSFTQFFYSPPLFLGQNERALIDSIDAEKIEVEEKIFQKISYRDRPDGLLGVAKIKPRSEKELHSILSKKNPFIVIAEAIEKPGNLGSILRSADATGCDALIVANRCTDIYNPNVIRSSVGTIFTVKVFELDNLITAELMKQYNIQMVATTPHTNHLYYDVDLKQGIAILVGTEQIGLSDFWMKKATIQVKIPMLGKADSLNVANATTVMMYEVVRQRYTLPR